MEESKLVFNTVQHYLYAAAAPHFPVSRLPILCRSKQEARRDRSHPQRAGRGWPRWSGLTRQRGNLDDEDRQTREGGPTVTRCLVTRRLVSRFWDLIC